LLDRFGPWRFVWGSDMPNVERYCAYRQTFTYVWNHADFLNDADWRAIFRANALAQFHRDRIAGTG
jgi:predicted TIM-barrel fold metal-dependent hydrolase